MYATCTTNLAPLAIGLEGVITSLFAGHCVPSSEVCLFGFVDSNSGEQAGGKGLVWTEEKMLDYLKDPAAFMPGNKMTFAGVKDEADRRDLVAYLNQFSK